MNKLSELRKDILAKGSPSKAKASQRFFKTGPGQYGEGDVFIGLTIPELRNILKNYRDMRLADLEKFLHSKEHEFRLAALLILTEQFPRCAESQKKKIYEMYLRNTKWINNWDLVDTSAAAIVGEYLQTKSVNPLLKLAKSKHLWERRIAMVAAFAYIRRGESKAALKIASLLINDTHDLMHKAVGWMLREIGKRASIRDEIEFLERHAATMPRTALRYAIERFTPEKKTYYMNKKLVQK